MCDCTNCFPIAMELNQAIDSGENIKSKLSEYMYHKVRNSYKRGITIDIGRCPCDTEYLCETFQTETMGIGVRTVVDIRPETVIGCYLGCIRKTENAPWVYAFEYGLNGYVVDGSDKRSMMSYVNHSNHPNLDIEYMFHIVNGKKQIHIVFKTNNYILAGEELFINYGTEYWEYSIQMDKFYGKEPTIPKNKKKQTKITNYFCKLFK